MKYIDDLSFSGIVSLIDGNETNGSDVLNNIAHEMEANKKIIGKLEKDLQLAKNREGSLITGTQRVMQHLKRKYPLAVQREGYVVIVTEENISIERNVM